MYHKLIANLEGRECCVDLMPANDYDEAMNKLSLSNTDDGIDFDSILKMILSCRMMVTLFISQASLCW